jgi:GAF domain-containing protein
MALPEHPELKDLLFFINSEVKQLLNTEGSFAILHDEIKGDLIISGAAYDDPQKEKRIEDMRFSMDELIAGRVLRSGEPIIVSDTTQDKALHEERDRRLGFKNRNFALVPLKSSDRIIGVLCATNKKGGVFDQGDVELLSMVAGTVALSVENARFSEELKKALRSNEAMLKISLALPRHPDLENLLEFISEEANRLLDSEGAVVILQDEEKKELFFMGAAYDTSDKGQRVKASRFLLDELVAGKVFQTGESMIVSDTSEDPELHAERDKRLGYKTHNLAMVPLRLRDRITGVLCAINKKNGEFQKNDLELLNMVAGTVALSIENARVSSELKKAYEEVTSLNRAKDKAINHLSHELKTPLAILMSSVNSLSRKVAALPEEKIRPGMERIQRNLKRILEIQYEVNDIMEGRDKKAETLMSQMMSQCTDELAALIAEETGEEALAEKIRARIRDMYQPREVASQEINLAQTVKERLESLKPLYAHRDIQLNPRIEDTGTVLIPPEVLEKLVDGLIRNAVENTPDEGKIEITVQKRGGGSLLLVHDYGVGITEDAQKRIFEGFFSTRDTMAYSTRQPFDFLAGGKGADLLRMKILSERYHFQISMTSTRCGYIPREEDICPGRISRCRFCARPEDCYASGETTFEVYFPPLGEQKKSPASEIIP